ncbi:MAG: Na+/H+ antiporter NhaA [Frankiaceae bacterium]
MARSRTRRLVPPAIPVVRRVLNPLRAFLRTESAGGVVLLIASAAALIWANSAASASYTSFWHHELTLGWGDWAVQEDLQDWVNDGLMTIFFFVVGLEIKRELTVGELRDRRAALLPAIAALGGVLLPAVIYLLIVSGGPGRDGRAIPMATDIAFAVGVLTLFGSRVSGGAKLFLLALAIVDDLIAITVIALFYSDHVSLGWLAAAVAGLLVVVLMGRFGVASPWAYLPVGLVVWLATLESGVHATIAGVALGLLTPAQPVRGREVLADLEHRLHPLSAFLIVPVFALANVGVYLRHGVLGDALGARITWAVATGLVVGKLAGIGGATLLALRAGWGVMPADMRTAELAGVAALGGIGFTVSLFITDLAFTDETLVGQAKVGVFVALLVAGALGSALLLGARRARSP